MVNDNKRSENLIKNRSWGKGVNRSKIKKLGVSGP